MTRPPATPDGAHDDVPEPPVSDHGTRVLRFRSGVMTDLDAGTFHPLVELPDGAQLIGPAYDTDEAAQEAADAIVREIGEVVGEAFDAAGVPHHPLFMMPNDASGLTEEEPPT